MGYIPTPDEYKKRGRKGLVEDALKEIGPIHPGVEERAREILEENSKDFEDLPHEEIRKILREKYKIKT